MANFFARCRVRIALPTASNMDPEQMKRDLARFIAQPGPAQVPPCPACAHHIPEQCSSRCVSAAPSLSSEPSRYPIEVKVVALVFELSATRLLQPCWSCEGHLGPDGELWKTPQVSFYSASPLYIQLLLRHIYALTLQKRLVYSWHVVVSDFGQTWDLTYTLEPDFKHDKSIHLGNLQSDLQVLAEDLSVRLKALAKQALEDLH